MLLDYFYLFRYIKPVWYFNLSPDKGETPYWVDTDKLSSENDKVIRPDHNYQSVSAQKLDASFQAWNRGMICHEPGLALKIQDLPDKPGIVDNYRFIRKYYSKVWPLYILLVRVCSFHNPFREFSGFWKSRSTKRVNLFDPSLEHPGYKNFQSDLVNEKPTVSIILPTLNRYKYLKDAIDDLGNQTIPPHEIIVIDQTDEPDKAFYEQFSHLPMKLIFQDQKGQWLARNRAIQQSTGDYILMFDDDSRVDPDWTEEHLKGLDYFKADISAGVSLSTVGAKIPENYSYFRWADQFDSGNAMIRRNVFKQVGLFDRQYDGQRMGDGEFGLRSYLDGFKSISHPYAKRIHLKVPSGGLRQMGSWDGFRPKKLTAPRPIPSVLFLFRKYFGKKLAIYALMQSVPPSIMPYKFKSNRFLLLIGFIISLLISPLVLLQVRKSWGLASKMLQEGDRIEWLEK